MRWLHKAGDKPLCSQHWFRFSGLPKCPLEMYSWYWYYWWVKTQSGMKTPLSLSQLFFNFMCTYCQLLTHRVAGTGPAYSLAKNNRYRKYCQSNLSVYSEIMWIKWEFSTDRIPFQNCLHILMFPSIHFTLSFTKILAFLSHFSHIHIYCGFCLECPSLLFSLENFFMNQLKCCPF